MPSLYQTEDGINLVVYFKDKVNSMSSIIIILVLLVSLGNSDVLLSEYLAST